MAADAHPNMHSDPSSLVTRNFDYLKSINADYINETYSRYLEDAESVDPSWRYFFDGLFLGEATVLAELIEDPESFNQQAATSTPTNAALLSPDQLLFEARVFQWIQAIRNQGHLAANINPLFGPNETPHHLKPETYGLDSKSQQVTSSATFIGRDPVPLSHLIDLLQKTYFGTLAVELLQVQNPNERQWIEKRIEALQGNLRISKTDQEFALQRLTESEALEKFIHTRFVAQKRFSIEGGESLIPALDSIIETAAQNGAEEIVMGMAHRGRLNVLVNTFRKKPEYLFSEFEDLYRLSTDHGEGDVKYHKGYSYDYPTRQGKSVHLSMGFNPSHLEFINPVVMGMARAKQHQRGDESRTKVLSILMHGDAAFAGQGVVYESLQASRLEGYTVGGTLHIISNNQVGFTTDPKDSRSTQYCSDLARILDAPIFHVNGDDPEAVWIAAKLATEFRNEFKRDVVIDLVCYRKFGHNEGDEPAFTQPEMYRMISKRGSPRETYAKRLEQEGIISADTAQSLWDQATAPLISALEKVRAEKPEPAHSEYEGPYWSKYHSAHGNEIFEPFQAHTSANELVEISKKLNRFNPPLKPHPKLERLFEGRVQAVEQGKGIDWGNAEMLAYGTLIKSGVTVRMTGQDVRRGTFTHRHAGLVDFETGQWHFPINELHPHARMKIYNSHLSETAVMGYEFGWSVSDPDSLVIWEAQFGDFSNGAQVIIDQFIATSESKWHRASGLTLLLPHGFEGQGPEHSSARLERFLQLCGKNNMSVCYPSTPAQIFHLLRRQVLRPFRKPLVVMTPKSLLRHPKAVSTLTELSQGHFQEVMDDAEIKGSVSDIKRVMICSGKIYYELLEEREKRNAKDVAILRLEQFYPWPEQRLAQLIEKYGNAKEIFYVQEEPRNMGAWPFFSGMWLGTLSHFGARFPKLSLTYVGREICASPAVGSKKLHDKEQQEIILKAFQD